MLLINVVTVLAHSVAWICFLLPFADRIQSVLSSYKRWRVCTVFVDVHPTLCHCGAFSDANGRRIEDLEL